MYPIFNTIDSAVAAINNQLIKAITNIFCPKGKDKEEFAKTAKKIERYILWGIFGVIFIISLFYFLTSPKAYETTSDPYSATTTPISSFVLWLIFVAGAVVFGLLYLFSSKMNPDKYSGIPRLISWLSVRILAVAMIATLGFPILAALSYRLPESESRRERGNGRGGRGKKHKKKKDISEAKAAAALGYAYPVLLDEEEA